MAQKVTRLIYDTYLALIRNSVGTNLFRTFWARVNGKRRNITQDGELSCAFFVSSLLAILGLIKKTHGTVAGTIKGMEQSGWQTARKLRMGSVLVWEERNNHKHIGFFIGGNKAISNSATKRYPMRHHITFGVKNGKPTRKIEHILWHQKLER